MLKPAHANFHVGLSWATITDRILIARFLSFDLFVAKDVSGGSLGNLIWARASTCSEAGLVFISDPSELELWSKWARWTSEERTLHPPFRRLLSHPLIQQPRRRRRRRACSHHYGRASDEAQRRALNIRITYHQIRSNNMGYYHQSVKTYRSCLLRTVISWKWGRKSDSASQNERLLS